MSEFNAGCPMNVANAGLMERLEDAAKRLLRPSYKVMDLKAFVGFCLTSLYYVYVLDSVRDARYGFYLMHDALQNPSRSRLWATNSA